MKRLIFLLSSLLVLLGCDMNSKFKYQNHELGLKGTVKYVTTSGDYQFDYEGMLFDKSTSSNTGFEAIYFADNIATQKNASVGAEYGEQDGWTIWGSGWTDSQLIAFSGGGNVFKPFVPATTGFTLGTVGRVNMVLHVMLDEESRTMGWYYFKGLGDGTNTEVELVGYQITEGETMLENVGDVDENGVYTPVN